MNMNIDERETRLYELRGISKSLAEKIKDKQLELYAFKEQKKRVDAEAEDLRREK